MDDHDPTPTVRRGRRRLGVLAARIRIPLFWTSVVVLLLSLVEVVPALPALALFVVAFAVYLRLGTPRGPELEVHVPVEGRWRTINSPGDHVPSHGLHAYGQTYAVDLVAEPAGDDEPGRPAMSALGFHRPDRYPAFGQPVRSPVSGTVVKVHETERDHRGRSSVLGLIYTVVVEGPVREALGPRKILGNHVVVQVESDQPHEATWAALAHLRQRSVRVREGDEVSAGQVLAEVGNTGNSTEPHLHLQLMDHPNALFAAGVPMRFADDEVQASDRDERDDVPIPRTAEPFLAMPAGA